MRDLTSALRQATSTSAHASRSADPITAPVVIRTLFISGGIGLFLSYVGAFGTGGLPFLPRTAYMVLVAWAGALLGMGSFRLALSWRWPRGRLWILTPLSGVLMTPAMTLIVWGGTWLTGHGAPLRHLPGYAVNSLIMCLVMTAVAVALNRSRKVVEPAPPPPPKLLERLPLKLRGAEIWAVEAEDHYLRLHTSKGQDLILLRLADAVAELEGIEGAQVHRSWWVARDAITEAERGDGRAILTLKDGGKVPVSRTYAKVIREKGWI